MVNSKNPYFIIVVLIMLAMIVGACGETPTSPVTTTSGTTTSAVVTTVIATTNSGTTVSSAGNTTAAMAATSVSTQPNATAIVATAKGAGTMVTGTANGVGTAINSVTVVANTPANNGGTGTAFNLPAIPNTTEIQLTPDNAQQILKAASLPASLTNATVRIFVSDDDPAKLATDTDAAFAGSGYTFAIPGQSKPVAQGDSTFGIYARSGSLDVLTAVTDPAKSFASATSTTGMSDVLNQLKTKKSALIVVGANGMLQALARGQSTGAGNTAPTAAPTK